MKDVRGQDRADGRTDGRTAGRMDGRTHTRTDEGHFYSPPPPTSADNYTRVFEVFCKEEATIL